MEQRTFLARLAIQHN